MNRQQYDVVVLGGGPAGYVCAIRSAQLGLKVAVVEREGLGGVCLNWGCIPTKSLLHSAEVFSQAREAKKAGLLSGEVTPNLAAMVGRSRETSKRLGDGIGYLMEKNGISVIAGHGRLAGGQKVAVDCADGGSIVLMAKHVVIATGARASVPSGLEPDGQRIVTYRQALLPDRIPRSLLVVGGGVIGLEFASFYRALGAEVTVAEAGSRVLAGEDEEIAAAARKAFTKRGIRILTDATAAVSHVADDQILVALTQKARTSELVVDGILVATGTVANIEDLGLETTRVAVANGRIVVDQWCRTAEPGVYAIGDVISGPWVAHKASHEGALCAEHMAGVAGAPVRPDRVPSCIFTDPQVASIGMTEARARAEGRLVKVGRFPLLANGKALAIGRSDGMVKVVFDANDRRLLGAHLLGAEVTEMIHGFAIALAMKCTIDDLAHVIFPHPTVSEAMHEAVLAADFRPIHQ